MSKSVALSISASRHDAPELGLSLISRGSRHFDPYQAKRHAQYLHEYPFRVKRMGSAPSLKSLKGRMNEIDAFHDELLAAEGNREAIIKLINGCRQKRPEVLSYVLLSKRYSIFKSAFENRRLRIALTMGQALF